MRAIRILKTHTPRDITSLNLYLKEIDKFKLLTPEQEVELAYRIKAGDQKALNELVNVNLRFVVSIANQYKNNGVCVTDLINEGNLGLIKAAQRFDPTRGFKFISFAVWHIRQMIIQALISHANLVRLPANQLSTWNKISKISNKLSHQLEREPTHEEIAAASDISLAQIKSITASFENQELLELESVTLQSEQKTNDKRVEIERALSTLPPDEAEFICRYFGLNDDIPMNISLLCSSMKKKWFQVNFIHKKAIRRLKQAKNLQYV